MPSVSVIVAVYNATRALELALAGLERQSEREFETVIADDGSGPEIAALLARERPRLPGGLMHVWQDDVGFRKTRIANEAVARATGDYLIFMDGDCIPHRHWVRDHLEARVPGAALVGRRVELGARFTVRITRADVERGRLDRITLRALWSCVAEGTRDYEKGIRLPDGPLLRRLNAKPRGLLGSNYSIARADFVAINGYDESITGRGLEDTDLGHRLGLAGIRLQSLVYRAAQYHLDHPKGAGNTADEEMVRKILANQEARSGAGVVGHGER